MELSFIFSFSSFLLFSSDPLHFPLRSVPGTRYPVH